MKRILALLLALLLLTGCSTGATEENTITTISPTENEAEASTVPATESPTEAPTEQPTEAPTDPPATEPPATEHKHNYSSRVTAPTCTGKGYTTYTCTCGYSYKGSETPAKGHAYKDTVVEPTCTEKGYTEHKCQTCGHSYKDNKTNATGHIISTKVIQQATCTETGLMQNVCENKGCSYTYDIEIEAKGHKYETTTVAPTTEAKGYDLHTCSVCGHSYKDNYTDKLPEETEPSHKHNYTKEVTAPECELEGYTTYTCSCGYSYTDDFTEPLGHDYGEWIVQIEPTLETEGLEYRVCQRYFSEDTRCADTQERTIPKLPEGSCEHSWGDWTSDDNSSYRSCTACGEQQVLDGSDSAYCQDVITIINQYRVAEGLQPVEWFAWKMMLIRADELTVLGSHKRPDGSYGVGTCIAGGYNSAQAVVDAWMGSSSHRGSLMNPNATEASAAHNGSFWVLYIG